MGSVVSFNKLIKYKYGIHDHRILSGVGIQVVFKLSLIHWCAGVLSYFWQRIMEELQMISGKMG